MQPVSVSDITPKFEFLTGDAISGGNAFAVRGRFKRIDAHGDAVWDNTGPITAFLSQSNSATAVAAYRDGLLDATCTAVGEDGKWLITFGAEQMIATLLTALFRTSPPFLIVMQADGTRTWLPLRFLPHIAASF